MLRKRNKRIVFQYGEVIHVITRGYSGNMKITNLREIVQTYHFSVEQLKAAQSSTKMKEFFSLSGSVCLDCPLQNGGCYTHKYPQFMGFTSLLRAIHPGEIKTLQEVFDDVVKLCRGQYVRFGTFGEPVLLGLELVSAMCAAAKSWTGYTHQWAKNPGFAPYFHASVETIGSAFLAEANGFKYYLATTEQLPGVVVCPASKESGRKTVCSSCKLCRGASGKNIQIKFH